MDSRPASSTTPRPRKNHATQGGLNLLLLLRKHGSRNYLFHHFYITKSKLTAKDIRNYTALSHRSDSICFADQKCQNVESGSVESPEEAGKCRMPGVPT